MDDPPILADLLKRAAASVEAITRSLLDGESTVEEWHAAMRDELATAHTAAALAGAGGTTLDAQQVQQVGASLLEQYRFLDDFAEALMRAWDTSGTYPGNTSARAAMYADASGATYWNQRYRSWPLPAVPRDGTTQCLTKCKCQWRIIEISDSDADCYWQMGDAEHCQTCEIRSRNWRPLQIRNGHVIINAEVGL